MKNTGQHRSKIPKDHKGLYACEPFNHGVQQDIIHPSNEEERMFMNSNFGKMGEKEEKGGKRYENPILYLRKSEKGKHLYAFDVESEDGTMVLGGKTESLIMNVSDVQAVISGEMKWAKVSVMQRKEG